MDCSFQHFVTNMTDDFRSDWRTGDGDIGQALGIQALRRKPSRMMRLESWGSDLGC